MSSVSRIRHRTPKTVADARMILGLGARSTRDDALKSYRRLKRENRVPTEKLDEALRIAIRRQRKSRAGSGSTRRSRRFDKASLSSSNSKSGRRKRSGSISSGARRRRRTQKAGVLGSVTGAIASMFTGKPTRRSKTARRRAGSS
jgi:hypothetical protein